MTFVTFENEVKLTRFELGLRLALVFLCTEFSEDTSTISSDTEQKPFAYAAILNDLCDLENKVKVTQWSLSCPGASVYQIW